MTAARRAGRCMLIGLALQTGCLASASTPPQPEGSGRDEAVENAEASPSQVDLPTSVSTGDSLCDLTFQLDEELSLQIPVQTLCESGGSRAFPGTLPPGAIWDASTQVLRFTPDAFQGGRAYPVLVEFWSEQGELTGRGSLQIQVHDTVTHPNWTLIDSGERVAGRVFRYQQLVNEHLAAPHVDAADFIVEVGVPAGDVAPASLPLRVYLHGFNGAATVEPVSHEFRLAVADPHNTYWYGETGPDGLPHPYTERRVLHAVEQALREFPAIDPDRVYLVGPSMGGAGAATIGLLHHRHFAWVYATIGQAIPRNHRAVRVAQLASLWGAPSSVPDGDRPQEPWDTRDLTWLVEHVPGAVDQFLVLKHGKDDAIIHFGAMLEVSPLTGRSFYESMALFHIAGLAAWDEGGHGTADPLFADEWWMDGWDPAAGTPAIRRSAPTVAAVNNSCDQHPGTRAGDGTRAWDPTAGFAGQVELAGDSGWGGDASGARNRGLRWETEMDTVGTLQIAAWTEHPDCPQATATLTVHRAQWFRLAAGEQVRWDMGEADGIAIADERGLITVEGLTLTRTPTTLRLQRIWR